MRKSRRSKTQKNRPYRTRNELLACPPDMTKDERKRLERIERIPSEVVNVLSDRILFLRAKVREEERAKKYLRETKIIGMPKTLQNAMEGSVYRCIMQDEKELDTLLDFLNGEEASFFR